MKLFDLEAIASNSTSEFMPGNFLAIGAAAQYQATAELLQRGHKVAIPVTDDDGVDLIVNYRTTVQIKSSAQRIATGALAVTLWTERSNQRTKGRKPGLRPHVDVLMVYARDSGAWWVIPTEQMRAVGWGDARAIHLSEHPSTRPSRQASLSGWRDAWWVFDEDDR